MKVRIRVRISNRVRGRSKLINYSSITALPIATSADPLFTCGRIIYVILMLNCNKPETEVESDVR